MQHIQTNVATQIRGGEVRGDGLAAATMSNTQAAVAKKSNPLMAKAKPVLTRAAGEDANGNIHAQPVSSPFGQF